jgi:hypothetical protein
MSATITTAVPMIVMVRRRSAALACRCISAILARRALSAFFVANGGCPVVRHWVSAGQRGR